MTSEHVSHAKRLLINCGIAALLIVPILIFCLPLLLSSSTFTSGDFDMQIQMTEAARLSILHYGQFPFWNPWTSGGVPLFADPQFGLFTITTLFALITNAVIAWKLTLFLYLVVGFFSMRLLLKEIGLTYTLPRIFLSYIYVFGSFFIVRFDGGHFTFLLLLLLPLAVYLLLSFKSHRFRFVQFMLLLAYLLYAAIHYATILILLFLGTLTVLLIACRAVQLIRTHKPYRKLLHSHEFARLVFLLKTLLGAIIIASPRIWLTFNYLHDSAPNRSHSPENFFGVINGLKALFLPYETYTTPHATYGPFEATNYIGTLTGCLILILIILFVVQHARKKHIPKLKSLIFVLAMICTCAFIIGLGGSIFSMVQHLPIFSSMRVSTRYFTITAFCLILLLGSLIAHYRSPKAQQIITALLLLATLQVFSADEQWVVKPWSASGSGLTTLNSIHTTPHAPPEAVRLWRTNQRAGNYNLTGATITNRDQIITDNALVETRAIGSDICEGTLSCPFVASHNAKVLSWSPNRIVLQRTAPGDIVLNSNIGSGWRVNGKHVFKDQKVVSSHIRPVISATVDGTFTLSYQPYYIPPRLSLLLH